VRGDPRHLALPAGHAAEPFARADRLSGFFFALYFKNF